MVLLVLVVFFVGIALASLFHAFYVVHEVVLVPMDAYVVEANSAGFNLDPDKIHFGLVPVNSPYATRAFEYNNTYGFPVILDISVEGDIAPMISYEHNGERYVDGLKIYLEPGERGPVTYIFAPDSSAHIGTYYQGNVRVVVKRQYFLHSLFRGFFS